MHDKSEFIKLQDNRPIGLKYSRCKAPKSFLVFALEIIFCSQRDFLSSHLRMSLEISSPQLSYGEYSPTRRSTAASSNAFASRASASVRVSTTERDLRAECFQLAKENERKDSKIETLTKEIQQLRNAITNQQVSSRSLLQVPTCRPSLFVVGSTLLPVRIFPFVMVTNARSLSFFSLPFSTA